MTIPLFRQGLKHTFLETIDITVAGEVENSDDLIAMVQQHPADEYNLYFLILSCPAKGGWMF